MSLFLVTPWLGVAVQSCIEWISIKSPTMAGRVLWIRVSLPFHTSIWKFSWNWLISMLWNSARGPLVLCMTEPYFVTKIFLPQKWRKWAKNRFFFEFIGKLSFKFFVNLVYNKSFYYLLYSCWFLRYEPKCSRPIRL